MMLERLIEKAEKILRSGQPLPLDFAARLMSYGIDVTELELSIEANPYG